jgi:hypothetical protein
MKSCAALGLIPMIFLANFLAAAGAVARGGRARGERGSNLRIKVKMTLEEVATGVNKKIKVRKQVACAALAAALALKMPVAWTLAPLVAVRVRSIKCAKRPLA